MDKAHEIDAAPEIGARSPTGLSRWLVRIAAATILILAINQSFNLGFFVGVTMIDLRFYYAIIALALASVFLLYPLRAAR